jgi:hypothetical protein
MSIEVSSKSIISKSNQDYENLSKKDLIDMYSVVLEKFPENPKKYEILQEITDQQIYKTLKNKDHIKKINQEIKSLYLKEKLTEFEKSRIVQLQNILKDLI